MFPAGATNARPGVMNVRSIWLVALAVLASWNLFHLFQNDHWNRPPLPHGDGPDYESIAYSLSQGQGFQFAWQSQDWQSPYLADPDAAHYNQLHRSDRSGPTASRPPLYPVLIACVYSVAGRGPFGFSCVRVMAALATALAGSLAVAAAFVLGSRCWAGRWNGRWTGGVAAGVTLSLAVLDRTVRTYSVDFLTEPLALLWTTCLCLTGLFLLSNPRSRMSLMLMALWTALLVLTRSIAILWVPGIGVLILLSVGWRAWWWAAVYFAMVFVLLSPWWVRNCVLLQRAMPMGGQGAASLRGGYSDEALLDRGNWHADAEIRLQSELDREPGSEDWTQAQREVALADRASQETWEWIQERVWDLPRLMVMRVQTHWGPYFGPSLLWRLAMLMGAVALVVRLRPEGIWLIGLPILSTLSVAVLYATGGRFLVPLYGVLYALAGLGVAGLYGLAEARWAPGDRS